MTIIEKIIRLGDNVLDMLAIYIRGDNAARCIAMCYTFAIFFHIINKFQRLNKRVPCRALAAIFFRFVHMLRCALRKLAFP